MIFSRDLDQISWRCVHYAQTDEADKAKIGLKNGRTVLLECDVSDVKSDEMLFHKLAKVFNFPDYFGHNWDAFNECLSDLEWLPADSYILFLSGSELFWKKQTFTAGKLVSAWLSAAEQWSREGVPFHLVFVLEE